MSSANKEPFWRVGLSSVLNHFDTCKNYPVFVAAKNTERKGSIVHSR